MMLPGRRMKVIYEGVHSQSETVSARVTVAPHGGKLVSVSVTCYQILHESRKLELIIHCPPFLAKGKRKTVH